MKLKNATDWIDGHIGDAFTFRDSKAIQFRTFGELHKALEFVGLNAVDANANR